MQMNGSLWKRILSHKYFYLFLLPAVLYYVIFTYFPIYGITLSFKEFNFSKGIIGSPWIGFANFKDLFSNPDFWKVTKNTFIISFGRILFQFPCPIILALLVNEISRSKLKRLYQTVYTFPHFLSWVVVSGIMFNLLSDAGVMNQMLAALGGEKINFLASPGYFRPLLYITNIWKEAGWDTIIYLAVLSGINPEIYESSEIDGANRLQRAVYITWPELRSVVMVLLVLTVGNVMNAGFDQIVNLYNAAVYDVSDIIDTYIYRTTFLLGNATFGYSSAVGLFKSVVNFILLFGANQAVKLFGEEGVI